MSVEAKPRYQQLKEQIIRRISNGELRPLDRVPSENELVGSAGVSRMTANRALRELTSEGYLERIAGVGTFVADLKAASHVLEVRNIADEIAHRGHSHSADVLKRDREQADLEVADALKVQQGEEVFHLLIVHKENGAPIQYEDRYVLASFAPDCLDQDFTRITPSAYLTGISPLQEAQQIVKAVMPDARVRKTLQMKDREPCLMVRRLTWARGRPVSLARLYHPGERFELTGHYSPPGIRKNRRNAMMKVELR
jgi:GntR family transcriptional regulator, histidine utilization repressor